MIKLFNKGIFKTILSKRFLAGCHLKRIIVNTTKANINKLGLHKTIKLLHSRGDHNKTKRQPTEWENIFANHQKIHFKLHQSSFSPFYPGQSLDFMDFTVL